MEPVKRILSRGQSSTKGPFFRFQVFQVSFFGAYLILKGKSRLGCGYAFGVVLSEEPHSFGIFLCGPLISGRFPVELESK